VEEGFMEFKSIGGIYGFLGANVEESRGGISVLDAERVRAEAMDALAWNAALNSNDEVKRETHTVIKLIAADLGIKSASIQNLYEAMGRGECSGFTVPAINIRGLTYDVARAVFRAGAKHNAGAFIFEIAKSEIVYTGQRPAEYTACCLAAAIKEGFEGPVFIQGDHFQVNAKNFAKDRDAEIEGLKRLIKEAVEAGFYNIDIDASTTVDLSKPTVEAQQAPNFETTALLTEYIREVEPTGVTVSVGGEIGEVGSKNSTEEELRAFMDGFLKIFGTEKKGISKISIQTGTSHGGVALPDGTIAEVKVDFDIIEKLSKISREAYGLAGVVQHGASTLPDDAFHIFPEKSAAEVHLATGFQNMIYESGAFPKELKKEIYGYLDEKHSGERKEGDTDEQFYYKTRKKAFGPFKEKLWGLDAEKKNAIGAELEARFDLLFTKLNAVDTIPYVKKWIG
jgi:hypothetical protein